MPFNIKLLRRFPEAEALIQSEDFVPGWFLGLATLIVVGSIDRAIEDEYIAFQDEETEIQIRKMFPKHMDGFIDEKCGKEFLQALEREVRSHEEGKLQ